MPVRRLTGILGRAPARLNSRNQLLAFNQAARCNTFARNPALSSGCLAGDGLSSWPGDRDPHRPPGYERVVTVETVSKLCHQGQLIEAVESLGVLVQTHCCISRSLFYTVLKRCVVSQDLVVGRRVHALAVQNGYQTDTFLCNHILRMYASHGRLGDAMDVFTMVTEPDAYMWSSIISAHVKHGEDKQATQLYNRMRRSSVRPDGHVFVAALQACARGADLKTGQQVHADLLATGVEPDLFVCNGLVDMYAKCGSLEDAQRVFDGLRVKDVVTWSTMIAGYSQQGMGEEALHLYSAMQEDGMAVPNSVTFVCLLQGCASVGTAALDKGRQLHAQIKERGHEADVFVANSLVNMYAKCGSLEDAHGVFDGLVQRDVVTWNGMIAGYSQQGMGHEALHMYSVMQEEGLSLPNSVTFVCLLQACASLGTLALEKGKHLHAQIKELALQADVFVASSLVDMYAKCGSLEDAHGVFDTLDHKNEVTWSAMIAGYSQQGMGQEALRLHINMEEEGITAADSVTFACLLQACASVGTPALEKGKKLHAQIRERGHEANNSIANSLVNMYAKCGSLEDALSVFEKLGEKDVFTWTALIAGFSQQGMGQEALRLYSAMQQDSNITPDYVTFVCLLQACASVGTPALEKGKQLHTQISQQGHQAVVVTADSLIDMYTKCGSLEDAQRLFDGLGQKDVKTWNAMIEGYSQQGMGREALHLYNAMQEEGIAVPSPSTYVCLLQVCASVGSPALETGKQLHSQIRACGHQDDLIVANSLVNMYAKCGSLEDSERVFHGLGQKDVVTWTALIAGYSQQGRGQEALRLYSSMQEDGMAVPDSVTFVCLLQACASVGAPALEKGKQLHLQTRERGLQGNAFVANSLVNMYAKCGNVEHAQRVFDGLGQKDVVTWNAMIAGYSQQSMGQEALHLYSAMQEHSMAVPDPITFVSLLQACANVAALHLGRKLHAQIEEQGLQADAFIAGSLINMYGKSGSMVDAQQVFEALPERDVIAWNVLFAGYSSQGDSEKVFDLVLRMTEDGIQPDGITFLSVLTACSHAGLVDKGQEYFDSMRTQHGITPTLEHYTCMVDLLGRAGRLHQALALVSTMPTLPSSSIWHTLLAACRKWSNIQVGDHAFAEAMKLDKNDAAAYTLMSNIYTSARMWKQAQEMQSRRIHIRAWKQPGQSWWTDMAGLVHSFLVGNEKHPKSRAMRKHVASRMPEEQDAPHVGTGTHI